MFKKHITLILIGLLVNNQAQSCEQKHKITIEIDGKPVVIKSHSNLEKYAPEIKKGLTASKDGSYDLRPFEAAYYAARLAEKNAGRTKLALAFGAGACITAGIVIVKATDYFDGMFNH